VWISGYAVGRVSFSLSSLAFAKGVWVTRPKDHEFPCTWFNPVPKLEGGCNKRETAVNHPHSRPRTFSRAETLRSSPTRPPYGTSI